MESKAVNDKILELRNLITSEISKAIEKDGHKNIQLEFDNEYVINVKFSEENSGGIDIVSIINYRGDIDTNPIELYSLDELIEIHSHL